MRNKSKNENQFIILLGKRIRTLRKAKGFTNADFFAYENDIDRSQFGKYERGMDMTFSSIVRLTEAFEISLKDFFAEGFDLDYLDKKQPLKEDKE